MASEPKTNTRRHNRIQDTMKPLLWSMKLFGVYHEVHDITSVSPSIQMAWQSNPNQKWGRCSILRCYNATILVIMWANVIRYGMAILPSDRYISLRIAVLVWLGLVALGDLIMFIICEKKTHLRSFYKHWNELYEGNECDTTEFRGPGSSRAALVGTLTGWSFVMMNVTILLYMIFYADMADLLTRPFHVTILSNVLLLTVMFLASGIYAFPIMFIVVTCYEMMSSFDKMSAVIEKHVRDAGDGVPLALDKLRRIHLQMCRGVSLLDRSFRLLVVAEYITNIPLACFLVYLTVNVLDNLFLIASNLMFISLNIFVIAAITCSCALVHEAVGSTVWVFF